MRLYPNMKIDFYPCFQYLNNFNNIYFYSDPHFNDKTVNEFRKDYIGDEEQIKRINSKVGKKDVLFILGDIGDISFIEKIRGYKILITGNHDKGKTTYLKSEEHPKLFDEVYDGVVALNEKILISHEQVFLPFMFNIHGHDHSHSHSDEFHLNVCAEHIDYQPISLKELIARGTFKNIESIHRFAIDRAIERLKCQENTTADENDND